MTDWQDGAELDPAEAKAAVERLLADPAKAIGNDDLTRDDPLPGYDETPEPE